jgi:hypothetical protein
MIRIWSLPVLVLVMLAPCVLARADTRRVAVVVGNNQGSGAQPALRFAESDAEKLAMVLRELGDVRPDDLSLLQGASAERVRMAVRAARAKVNEAHAQGNRAVVVFYFSGHSDGLALELGRQRLGFAEIRTLLEATGADLRVAIVDTCKSGSLLAVKGGTPSPAFQIRLSDELDSKGEALLTSSAASELALESREIGGSFFTHHLVSGLRGAADRSGDGRVTLAEAYDYAFARTVSATARTVIGPQHPTYAYRIAGEGELVLARLGRSNAGAELSLPREFERVVVLDGKSERVLAEVTSAFSGPLALPEGPVRVLGFRDGRVFERKLTLSRGQRQSLDGSGFQVVERMHLLGKGGERDGGELDAPFTRPIGVTLSGGATQGVAAQLGVVPGVRVGLELGALSGVTVAAQATSGRGPTFRETTPSAAVGGRYGRRFGHLAFFAGAEVGGGAVLQRADGKRYASGLGYIAPVLGAAYQLQPAVAAFAQFSYAVQLLRRDGALDTNFVPAAWLGLRVAP